MEMVSCKKNPSRSGIMRDSKLRTHVLVLELTGFDAQVTLRDAWRAILPHTVLDLVLRDRLPAGTRLVVLSSELSAPSVQEGWVFKFQYYIYIDIYIYILVLKTV